MLYLLRPPENSSGPQPRARNTEAEGGGWGGGGEKERDNAYFIFNVMIHSIFYFSYSLLLSLLQAFTIAGRSLLVAVFEHTEE